MDDDQRYREPGWWNSLTPLGQTSLAILATLILFVLVLWASTIE